MTSETIIKQESEDRERKRVKELLDNVEKLYPAKHKFLYQRKNATKKNNRFSK